MKFETTYDHYCGVRLDDGFSAGDWVSIEARLELERGYDGGWQIAGIEIEVSKRNMAYAEKWDTRWHLLPRSHLLYAKIEAKALNTPLSDLIDDAWQADCEDRDDFDPSKEYGTYDARAL